MNTKPSRLSLIGGAVIGGAVVLLLLSVIATYPQPVSLSATTAQPTEMTIALSSTTVEPTPCPNSWSHLPPDQRTACGYRKGTAVAATEQAELLTAEVRPPLPPLPTLQGPPVPYGYVPESAQRIFEVDLREIRGVNTVLRWANSVWHIGALPGGDGYDYSSLNLYTKRPTAEQPSAILGTALFGNFVRAEDGQLYERRWVAPPATGTITITQVTGPIVNPTGLTGLVTFITSTGQTGAFDLGLQQWTIGNMVVVATPVPTIAVPLPTTLPTPSTDPYPVPLPSVTVAPSLVATAPSPP